MQAQPCIYLDHAATTPLRREALEAMLPYFSERFGNPSAIYPLAEQGHDAVAKARGQVAGVLGCKESEVLFTSGGTESDNAAIKGVAQAMRQWGDHIVTTRAEHHAVLRACESMERQGYAVTYLPVDQHGLVSAADVARAVTERTVLVSVMYANNEVGSVQPIAEIAKAVRACAKRVGHPIIVHTDAVQAAGFLDLNVDRLGVDLLSLSAHKFGGPKGCGVLYARWGTPFEPLLHGGGQEQNRRSGTENVPGIVGTGVALALAAQERDAASQHCLRLRERFLVGVFERIKGVKLNGHPTHRLPNNINVSMYGVDGEALIIALAKRGFAASTGSACSAGSPEPSHVLSAMGLADDQIWGSLRLTLGLNTTEAEMDTTLDALTALVARQRGGAH